MQRFHLIQIGASLAAAGALVISVVLMLRVPPLQVTGHRGFGFGLLDLLPIDGNAHS